MMPPSLLELMICIHSEHIWVPITNKILCLVPKVKNWTKFRTLCFKDAYNLVVELDINKWLQHSMVSTRIKVCRRNGVLYREVIKLAWVWISWSLINEIFDCSLEERVHLQSSLFQMCCLFPWARKHEFFISELPLPSKEMDIYSMLKNIGYKYVFLCQRLCLL